MRIFLSYRREDSSAWAGRPHDTLAARFGEQNIFQDVDVPGGVMRFDALAGDRTQEEPGASPIVTRVALENATSEGQYQDSSYYGLSVAGVQFLPDCFEIVAGQDPVGPAKRSDVLVGFEVPDDVRGPLVIDIETNEDGHGRIDV